MSHNACLNMTLGSICLVRRPWIGLVVDQANMQYEATPDNLLNLVQLSLILRRRINGDGWLP